jgi:LacI family transcriptional regulator
MTKTHLHPTLSQVARKAGVGTTTVSRVINGGESVSPETLARVRSIIDKLGYVPNQAARTLKGQPTKTIGLVIPSIADPFFSSCAEAIHSIARANGSLLIVTTTQNDPRTEIEGVSFLLRHRADGILIVPAKSRGTALSDLLARASLPVVSIDRPIERTSLQSVVADNYQGARTATKHLIDHGYKRIVCLTGESMLYTIRERIRGYRKAIEAAHLPSIINASVTDYKSAEDSIRTMFQSAQPPDAIFALKNSTTIFAFEALQRLKIPIPKTAALIGFDDFGLASTVRPAITVIKQPINEIGKRAAEILFEEMISKHEAESPNSSNAARRITLETCLVLRSSCGCRLADD